MSKEILELQVPLKVNGEDLTKLEYDIESISINDLAEIENERAKSLGKNAVPSIKPAQSDFVYHIFIGMRAIIKCNPQIDIEDLKRIKGYDLTQISLIGTRFFIPPASRELSSSEAPQEDTQESTIVRLPKSTT